MNLVLEKDGFLYFFSQKGMMKINKNEKSKIQKFLDSDFILVENYRKIKLKEVFSNNIKREKEISKFDNKDKRWIQYVGKKNKLGKRRGGSINVDGILFENTGDIKKITDLNNKFLKSKFVLQLIEDGDFVLHTDHEKNETYSKYWDAVQAKKDSEYDDIIVDVNVSSEEIIRSKGKVALGKAENNSINVTSEGNDVTDLASTLTEEDIASLKSSGVF